MGDFELPLALLVTIAFAVGVFLVRKVIGWVFSMIILVVGLAVAGFYLWNTGILEQVIGTGRLP